MPMEYVLTTIIQFVVISMMAVLIMQQSREITAMSDRINALIELNRIQKRMIDGLTDGRRDDDVGTTDTGEASP